jgi:hypothetical protein
MDRAGNVGIDPAIAGNRGNITLDLAADRHVAAEEDDVIAAAVDFDFAADHLGACGARHCGDGQPQGHDCVLDVHNSLPAPPGSQVGC